MRLAVHLVLPSALLAACALNNPAPPRAPAAWRPEPETPVTPQTETPQTETAQTETAPAASTGTGTAAAASDTAAAASDPTSSAAAAQPTPDAASSAAASTAQAPVDAGAAARAAPTAADEAPAGSGGDDVVVARVAGQSIYASELFAQWLYTGRAYAVEQLDHLVVGRLVVAEATRLGVKIDPDYAERSYARGLETLEAEIRSSRREFQDLSLDRYIEEVLGLDPRRYRERLRDETLRSLLGARVVRGWLLQNEHAFPRVIVVRSEDEKRAVEADLAAGQPFATVAAARSQDPSSKEGGRIPPIVRGKTAIASLAFATEPGQVGGPITEQGTYLFVLVEKRGVPLEGGWDVLGPAVEASLGEIEVDQLELEQWRRAMRDRYTIDRTPFLRLAGEAPR